MSKYLITNFNIFFVNGPKLLRYVVKLCLYYLQLFHTPAFVLLFSYKWWPLLDTYTQSFDRGKRMVFLHIVTIIFHNCVFRVYACWKKFELQLTITIGYKKIRKYILVVNKIKVNNYCCTNHSWMCIAVFTYNVITKLIPDILVS